ncbi:MAG: universal stress protein [Cyanobacteriota/Melainabacteria group bacterium]|nr:universal stress protein [Cyanobacteria bacterium HKST-UBA01]
MISRVLIAVDDNLFGDAMVELLKNLKWENTQTMRVIHVIEPIEPIAAWPSEQYKKDAEALIKRVSAHLRKNLPNSKVEEKLLNGHVTETIVDEAIDWNADLILVGSHGRRGFRRFSLGTSSGEIVSHAPCSVIVVRQNQESRATNKQQSN